jgi:LysR family glycine cleavage system transcriptional activator
MALRLPPLNALRAFEAAGRNASLTAAARELQVTPDAVSRQVRSLEAYLGFALFNPNNRRARFTEGADEYRRTLTDVFSRISDATTELVDSGQDGLLHIHTAMTFTLKWLVPRLPDFHARRPRHALRLSTTLPGAAVFRASPTDVYIHLRDEAWPAAAAPDLLTHRLLEIDLIPVCSPAYRDRHGVDELKTALSNITLLHSAIRPDDWRDWLGVDGLSTEEAGSAIGFESSSLAYQAAIEGVGVAIAIRSFVQKELEAGVLVTPFDRTLRASRAFYLTYGRAALASPQVMDFRDWVIAQGRADASSPQA